MTASFDWQAKQAMRRSEDAVDRDQAKMQWNKAAPGWAKWEPTIGAWMRRSTEAMLDAAGVASGARVIDIACGAGDQSIAAARRVGPRGSVLATDISEEMIGFVERQATAAGLDNLETRCCAAEDLRGEEQFDCAICRLGLMLIPDPQAVVNSMFKLLRPGGRTGAIVFASPGANPFMSGPLKILRRHASKAAPPPGSPGIFALSDASRLRGMFEASRFVDVSVESIDELLETTSAEEAVQMMQDAFGVYRAIIGDQPRATQDSAWAEVHGFLKSFEKAGVFKVPARLHVIGARRPS